MKLRYALVQNSLDGISAEVHYAFESGADVVETFSEWDAACSRMNQLYSEHGIAEQPVSLAASRWPYPATPLPIRASGHGQGTEERVERAARLEKDIAALNSGSVSRIREALTRDEEERVERAARVKAAVKRWFTIKGYSNLAGSEVACAGIAHDVLSAADAVPTTNLADVSSSLVVEADAVPGPEVEWTTEAPKEPGFWFWRFVGDTVPHVIELEGDDCEGYPFEFEGNPREWWPVPISEPPGTKGEGGR